MGILCIPLLVFIVVLCGLSILWIPLVKSSQSGQLFVYIQAVQGYLGTPIGALFLWAILWRRMNEHGAFWGIVIGHTCGVIRMVLDFVYPAPDCGEPETRPPVVYKIHYTYFGQMSLVITSLAIVIISLLTKSRDKSEIEGLTWWTRFRPKEDQEVTELEELPKENGTSNGRQTPQVDIEEASADGSRGWKKWVYLICGIPKESGRPMNVEAEEAEVTQKQLFLKETPFWRRMLNANACFALIVMAFLIGFFR